MYSFLFFNFCCNKYILYVSCNHNHKSIEVSKAVDINKAHSVVIFLFPFINSLTSVVVFHIISENCFWVILLASNSSFK